MMHTLGTARHRQGSPVLNKASCKLLRAGMRVILCARQILLVGRVLEQIWTAYLRNAAIMYKAVHQALVENAALRV